MKPLLEYIKKPTAAFLDVLFPARCVGCGREGAYVCERCTLFLTESEPQCPVCRKESSMGQTHASCAAGSLDGEVSCWEYEGLAKSLLRTIKEGGVSHAVGETVTKGFGTLLDRKEDTALFFEHILAENTAITFVPMSQRAEKKRGFNQASLIASFLGGIVGKEPFPLLRRIHDIPLEDDWDRPKRTEIMKGAFAMRAAAMPRQIVLVDDIKKSGATLQECSRVLKRAGAETVWAFVISRAP